MSRRRISKDHKRGPETIPSQWKYLTDEEIEKELYE